MYIYIYNIYIYKENLRCSNKLHHRGDCSTDSTDITCFALMLAKKFLMVFLLFYGTVTTLKS